MTRCHIGTVLLSLVLLLPSASLAQRNGPVQNVTTEWDSASGELRISMKLPRDRTLSSEEVDQIGNAYVIDFLIRRIAPNILTQIEQLEKRLPQDGLFVKIGLKNRKNQDQRDVVNFLKLRFASMMELGTKLDRVIELKFSKDTATEKRPWYRLRGQDTVTITVEGFDEQEVIKLEREAAKHYFDYVTHYDSLKSAFDLIGRHFSPGEMSSFQNALRSDLTAARGGNVKKTITLKPELIFSAAEQSGVPPEVADQLVLDYAEHVRSLIEEGLTEVAGSGVKVSEPAQEQPEVKHDRFDLKIDIHGDPDPEMLKAIMGGQLALWSGEDEKRPVSRLSFSARKEPDSLVQLTVNLGLERPAKVELANGRLQDLELRFLDESSRFDELLLNPRIEKLEEWKDRYTKDFIYTVEGYPGNLHSYLSSVHFQAKLKPLRELGQRFNAYGIEVVGEPQNAHFVLPDAFWSQERGDVIATLSLRGGEIPECDWYHSMNELLDRSLVEEVRKGKDRPLNDIEYESTHWIEMLEKEGESSFRKIKERSSSLSNQEIKVAKGYSWAFIKCVPNDPADDGPLYWFFNLINRQPTLLRGN